MTSFARCGGNTASASTATSLLTMSGCVVYQGASHGVGIDRVKGVLAQGGSIMSECVSAGMLAAKSVASATLNECQLLQNSSEFIVERCAPLCWQGAILPVTRTAASYIQRRW